MTGTAPVGPQPPSAPDPEKALKLDTRTKIMVGLIAFVATLAGALAGAGGAILAARINANAATSVAQSNFLHNQRQVAYTDFWTDISAANIALGSYMKLFESGGRGYIPTKAVMDPAQSTYHAAAQKASAAAGVVRLVGSAAVVSDLEKLTAASNGLGLSADSNYTAVIKGFSEGNPGSPLDAVFSDQHVEEWSAIEESGQNFLTDARVDLTR